MKTLKIVIVVTVATLACFADYSPGTSTAPGGFQLIAEAHAVLGVRRRVGRRAVAVGYVAGEKAAAQSQQQAAAQSQQQAAAPAPAPKVTYGLLPQGTVINVLPDGCTTMAAVNIEYYHCGDNYFRTAFQGSTLVYVTATPPKS